MATILVIDYCEPVLTMMRDYLETGGHNTIVTSSGRRALAMLRTGSFDLAITEIYMPEMDGLKILRETRGAGLPIPFVAMSSRSDGSNCFEVARFFGAAATLQKPFTMRDLDRAVTSALVEKTAAGQRASTGTTLQNQFLEPL